MDATIEEDEEDAGIEGLIYALIGIFAVAYIGVLIAIRYLRAKIPPSVEPTPEARVSVTATALNGPFSAISWP